MTDEQLAIVIGILCSIGILCCYFYVIERGDDQ